MKCAKRSLMLTNRQIKKLVQKFHQDGNGNIKIDEFLNASQNVVKPDAIYKALKERAGVRKYFDKYDRDGNGVLTRDEFCKVLEDKYQTKFRPDQVDEMMKNVDMNNDGNVDFEEFYKKFRYSPVTEI